MQKILWREDHGKSVELEGPAAPDLSLGLSESSQEPFMFTSSGHPEQHLLMH